MVRKIDLADYDTIFCDSKEALKWAYKNGLNTSATILTSSPSMLWDKNKCIKHIESRWSVKEFQEFQSSIKSFSEDIYDSVIDLDSISHEKAICIALAAVKFNHILFKASCLTIDHLSKQGLFIRVNGEGGLLGNKMNSPWDLLLSNNNGFKTVTYNLTNNRWSELTTQGISIIQRIKLGGFSAFTYRLLIKITKYIPNIFFKNQVLIPKENELIIETASSLAFNGVWIKEIKPNFGIKLYDHRSKYTDVERSIYPIIKERVEHWVCSEPNIISKCIELFILDVRKQLDEFKGWHARWKHINKENHRHNNVVLINSPSSISSLSLTEYCRELNIPVVSAQHGVTTEICSTQGEVSAHNEINMSDIFLSFNYQCANIVESSHFSRGKSLVVGLSARHFRMKNVKKKTCIDFPIVYVSTNLYKGNIAWFGTYLTDYHRAKKEQLFVISVLSKLPHKVRYKAYPMDNKRFPDRDPVFDDIDCLENIQLFDQKIDMRYLLDDHRVLITSMATSTIGWLVMSGKPVVFINWKNNSPLTKDAHRYFSDGLFLFDDDDDFHHNLFVFLSQPIEEIERLYDLKKDARSVMINRFFSSYPSGAGKRAATMIKKEYFNRKK